MRLVRVVTVRSTRDAAVPIFNRYYKFGLAGIMWQNVVHRWLCHDLNTYKPGDMLFIAWNDRGNFTSIRVAPNEGQETCHRRTVVCKVWSPIGQSVQRAIMRKNKLTIDRLVIASNRLPILPRKGDMGQWQVHPSPGGLVTALSTILSQKGGLWIGWPGILEKVDLVEVIWFWGSIWAACCVTAPSRGRGLSPSAKGPKKRKMMLMKIGICAVEGIMWLYCLSIYDKFISI